jgi:hypothetical protein
LRGGARAIHFFLGNSVDLVQQRDLAGAAAATPGLSRTTRFNGVTAIGRIRQRSRPNSRNTASVCTASVARRTVMDPSSD